MTALGWVVRSGVGRRRVQTSVTVLTTLLSVAASVLALGLLVASQAPFDKAFSRQNGAHLTVEFEGATAAQAERTATVDGVAATAGPYPVTAARLVPADGMTPGFAESPVTVVGRASADAAVDGVELTDGRWAKRPGEIVLEKGTEIGGPGGTQSLKAGDVELTVVGVAESVGESAGAWVTPAQLTALDAEPSYQMLYRLTDASSRADVEAAGKAVAAAAPEGTVGGTQSYFDVKQVAEESTAAFIPFVTAFALLGLALSVLVVGVVVSGAVGAATRRIGILKSLGFTPSQVCRAYVAQALIPAAFGAALGVVLGYALSVPLMAEVSDAYRTGTLLIPAWVGVVVATGALALVGLTALGPAVRAARLRTASVLGVGRAVESARGRGVRRLLGGLPLPRPVTLGLAGPFARPARSATTAGAVAFGTLAVVFAVGLATTLFAVQREGEPDQGGGEAVVRTTRMLQGPPPPGERRPGPPKPADPAKVAAAIAAADGTGSYYRRAETELRVAGLKDAVPVVAYGGAFSEAKYTMVSGRWFRSDGEAVAASRFLRSTGKGVGDTVTLSEKGRTVRLTIVGEVFDLGEDGMKVRTAASSLASLGADYRAPEYDIDVAAGTDAATYVKRLDEDLASLGAQAALGRPSESSVITAMQSLIAMLTLMLVAVACLGVLNTVVLDTRDRVRDLGVFKALGMSPRQTVAQVLTQVSVIGVLAGAVGVPLGVALHHYVMPAMGDAVGASIPPAVMDAYSPVQLVLLALAGVVIAVVGALLPAGWAAKTDTGRALRAE
ncbi:FtsX-like permease family protein [Streptomyces sp. NPDC018026]|uniref:ABC transporter permease n=1 Tax=Streptomyces sp. NPDC018026 TaxID=3365031 RepID=UPI0037938532